jgi:hypothetical protein
MAGKSALVRVKRQCVQAAHSWWLPQSLLWLTMAIFAWGGCAHTVSQDMATGNDGKVKGARPITMESGEGKATGIVTYPGGDRIDWKVIEIPAEKFGNLELKLSWQTPRPGLQLGMEVFDAWNYRIAGTRGRSGSNGRTRRLMLENVKGKYFIRIYAPNRGDAGKYKLTATLVEAPAALVADFSRVPDPPKLWAIPAPVVPCTDDAFDPKKKECKNFCPTTGAPPNWPPCGDKCPTPANIEIKSCQLTMQCPNPNAPDRRVKDCLQYFKKCDPKSLDPANPKCDNFKPDPIAGAIIDIKLDGDTVLITMNPGNEKGIDVGWRGNVLRGTTGKPIDGGDFTVISVGKRESKARVRLSVDVVKENQKVRFAPP